MRAMTLETGQNALKMSDLPIPEPESGEVQIRIGACAVCRTDLHIVDGDLNPHKSRLVPGHEIVGRIAKLGRNVDRFSLNQRVGVPWLGWTCGECSYCCAGHENLCSRARFTGYDRDGGFAEWMVADARYCFPIPDSYSDVSAAPLLCAGLIGFRSYRMAGDAKSIGFYGFGAAAHLLAQIARAEGRDIFVFTRPGDVQSQSLARELGAAWVGSSDDMAPRELDAAIIFAPVGALVPSALRAVRRGGIVICAGIHMSDIPSFPYELLWGERTLRSVANLTRADGDAFLKLATEIGIQPRTTTFSLEQANMALDRLRSGEIDGAAVIVP